MLIEVVGSGVDPNADIEEKTQELRILTLPNQPNMSF